MGDNRLATSKEGGTLAAGDRLTRVIPMLEGVQRCYQLAEVCRDRAAQARNSIDAEAWLKLAEDWLEFARADGQGHDNGALIRRAASD